MCMCIYLCVYTYIHIHIHVYKIVVTRNRLSQLIVEVYFWNDDLCVSAVER